MMIEIKGIFVYIRAFKALPTNQKAMYRGLNSAHILGAQGLILSTVRISVGTKSGTTSEKQERTPNLRILAIPQTKYQKTKWGSS